MLDAHAGTDLYWFLISKGYKTYRFLPVFFHEFYPRWDVPTPSWARAMLDAVARALFPEDYDGEKGIRPLVNRLRMLK